MGKNPDINAKKAAQIDILLKEGLSGKEIAKKVQVSESVVSRIKKKVLKNISLSPKKKKNCGRKRITSSRDDKILIREALKNRKATCKMHQKTMTAAGVALSCRTINRRLSEAGLMARCSRKKPKITGLNAKRRLISAKQFITWTGMDWKNGGKPSINLGNGKRKKRKRNDSEESLNLQEDESSLQRIKIEENLDKEIVGMDSTTGMKVFCDAFPSNPIQTPGDDKDYDNENERTIPHHSQSQENSSGHDFSHSSSHFIGNNDEFMHSHEYETEFDVFGKSVAKKLNSMPRNDALRLQQKMEEVMTNFEVQTLSTPDNSSVDVKMELTDDFIE